MANVVVIIPALNEEPTVAAVVKAARDSGVVTRVIVVDDGSTDRTSEEAENAGAEVIRLPENRGKGAAMYAGVQAAPDADVVVFLDADLVNLRPAQVRALVEPVVSGRADATLGVFKGGRNSTDLAQALTPFLSGNRALRREALAAVESLEGAGWGAEVAITRYLNKHRVRTELVTLSEVTQRTKEEKLGLTKGLAARARMYWDILRTTAR